MTGYFQIRFHSEAHKHQFIYFIGRSDGQGRRSHPGNGEIRLSFPSWQPVIIFNGSFLKSLIVADHTNDFREATARFNKVELSSLSGFIRGERTGDAHCIAR
ncbi:MAG: hypothetical protein DMF28_00590 [Verrucomicrobia bacterium]|nr:MAG: hypothetical protein DMF28_00590 [Verrucomicrobiota bacterium]